MSRESDKAKYEREVFSGFVNVAGIEIDSASIRNGDSNNNEPDIVCCLSNGAETGFELGRLIDPNLAKVVNRWEPRNGEYVRTSDPSREIARKKIKLTYDVGFPVQLVLYKEYPIITPDDVILPTIRPLCSLQHGYSAIWYWGDTAAELLFES